jgi:hypothetical protein
MWKFLMWADPRVTQLQTPLDADSPVPEFNNSAFSITDGLPGKLITSFAVHSILQ